MPPAFAPPPAARVTIAEVARDAGVHLSTVSRALNPATAHMVSADVVARVAQAAARLGYRRSAVAAGLRTGRTATVGILVPDLTNPVFPPIVRALERRLEPAGYAAFVLNTDNDPAREVAAVARLAAQRVDGLLIASAAQGTGAIDAAAASGIPVVLINRRLPGARLSAVVNDDAAGIGAAVRHLLALGHTRIAHLAGPAGVATAADRRRGFRVALRGVAEATAIVAAASYSREAGAAGAARLLADKPTALLCANDMLAIGAYDALEAAGLRVGADVSVTGFNDMPFMDRLGPPLTTVRIRHDEMGAEAADILLAAMAGGAPAVREIRLQPELVVRASTAPPRR